MALVEDVSVSTFGTGSKLARFRLDAVRF